VGLGVMGLQDALYDKKIAFDSVEAVDFNDEVMEAIACILRAVVRWLVRCSSVGARAIADCRLNRPIHCS
jgi:hypothetical protein